MATSSGITGDHDLVFPEGAALVFSVLSLRLPAWSTSPALLATVPATCAAVGVALTYVPDPRWVGEIGQRESTRISRVADESDWVPGCGSRTLRARSTANVCPLDSPALSLIPQPSRRESLDSSANGSCGPDLWRITFPGRQFGRDVADLAAAAM
jgi:hypothetical protein